MFSKAKGDGESKRKRKPAAPTIISADLTVTGNLTSEGEVQIDGVIDGDVKSARLSVGQHGKIVGSVRAERALVRGRVEGQIRAQEVTLTRTAQVKGDIFHDTLSIEPGAQLDGHCRRLNAVEDGETTNINLVVSDGMPTKS
jgi:cytoskeletal protein CcmA (bactofilin family)